MNEIFNSIAIGLFGLIAMTTIGRRIILQLILLPLGLSASDDADSPTPAATAKKAVVAVTGTGLDDPSLLMDEEPEQETPAVQDAPEEDPWKGLAAPAYVRRGRRESVEGSIDYKAGGVKGDAPRLTRPRKGRKTRQGRREEQVVTYDDLLLSDVPPPGADVGYY